MGSFSVVPHLWPVDISDDFNNPTYAQRPAKQRNAKGGVNKNKRGHGEEIRRIKDEFMPYRYIESLISVDAVAVNIITGAVQESINGANAVNWGRKLGPAMVSS